MDSVSEKSRLEVFANNKTPESDDKYDGTE